MLHGPVAALVWVTRTAGTTAAATTSANTPAAASGPRGLRPSHLLTAITSFGPGGGVGGRLACLSWSPEATSRGRGRTARVALGVCPPPAGGGGWLRAGHGAKPAAHRVLGGRGRRRALDGVPRRRRVHQHGRHREQQA